MNTESSNYVAQFSVGFSVLIVKYYIRSLKLKIQTPIKKFWVSNINFFTTFKKVKKFYKKQKVFELVNNV